VDSGGFLSSHAFPETIIPPLEKFARLTESWLIKHRTSSLRPQLIDIYFNVSNFMRIAGFFDQSYCSFFESSKSDIRIKLLCLDTSGLLKNALKRCSSAIFFSATMTPAEYFQEVLGCDESAVKLYLPSPFPVKNCLTIVSDRISTYYNDRPQSKKCLAHLLICLVKEKKGNYLFFFPSYQYLKMVLELFEKMNGEIRTIAQEPGMTESEREKFLQMFDENTGETLAGFAVMGGIFGEGIDLVGDRLCAAAIVGAGLPMICPERELIRGYYREKMGKGFDFAYKYPGINRVQQAAGRVIRSETDKGVLLFIDKRFPKPEYRRLFPSHLEIKTIRDIPDLQKTLASFWKKPHKNPQQ
jgi:DNA excision repair protein ERCC-2